jgi:hypothetical protein
LAVITPPLLAGLADVEVVGAPILPPLPGGVDGVTVSVDVPDGVSVNVVPLSAELTIDDTNCCTFDGLTEVT